MESIIALRRTNQKHWQARLSCSNCMPPCSPVARAPVSQTGLVGPVSPVGPELELTFSSYESEDKISKPSSRLDFPLEFLPCSAPSPRSEEKFDKQTEVKSEYKLAERQRQERPEKSEEDLKADKQATKSDRRTSKPDRCPLKPEKCSSKAEKFTIKLEKLPKPEKKETRPCSKTCPKELLKAEAKAEAKTASKAASKAASKEPSKTESKSEDNQEFELVCSSKSNPDNKSTKTVKTKKEFEPVSSTRSNDDKSTKSVKSDPDTSLTQPSPDSCFLPNYQHKVQEVAMGKEEKKKKKPKTPKPKPVKPPKDPKLERKSSAKTKNTKPKPKEKDKKKKPEKTKTKRFEPRKMKNNYPTFTQIGGSVSHNCFSCMDAMALYIKEFLRFSCSLTTGHPAQDTEFQERVCDMLNILRTMCRDCFYLVRYVLRLLFVD